MSEEDNGLEASLEGLGDFSKLIEVLRAKFVTEQSLTQLTRNEEKIRLCLENSNVKLGFEKYMNNPAFVKQSKEREKSSEKARELRSEGNKCFRNKKFRDALRFFSRAVVVAPIQDETSELAHAYANRSAALFHLNHFTDCLSDICLALQFGYPANQQHTLHLRKTLCFKALGRTEEAASSLAVTLSSVQEAGNYDEMGENRDNGKQEAIAGSAETAAEDYRKFVQSTYDNFTAEVNECAQEVKHKDHLKPIVGPSTKLQNASEWVKLATDPRKGRMLCTTRAVGRDEVVISEKAFATTLNTQFFDSFCYNCCEELRSRLYPCHDCSTVSFCSKDCYEQSWQSFHKDECPDLSIILSMGILRLSLRILMVAGIETAVAVDREAQKETSSPTSNHKFKWNCDYKSLYNLSDHSKDLSYLVSARQTLAASFMLFFLSERLKVIQTSDPDYYRVGALLLKQIHQISINSIVIFHQPIVSGPHDIYGIDLKSQSIGSAIFPTISLMNHSCVPNTEIFYRGSTAFVKTMQPLAAGQEITFSYGPIYKKMSRAERLDTLANQYYFKCDCTACSDRILSQNSISKPLEFPVLTEAYFCACRGPFVINSATEGKCLRCGKKSHDVREIIDRVESAKKIMNVGKALVQFGRSQEAEKQYQKTQSILSKICWPENRYLLAINSELLAVSLYGENLEEARKYCEECNRIKKASFGENSYEYQHGLLQLLNLKWAQHKSIAANMSQTNKTTRTPQMHKKLLTRLVSESVAAMKSVKQGIRENEVSGDLVLLDSSLVSCLKEMVELEKNLKSCQQS
jgi:hypothetical protein